MSVWTKAPINGAQQIALLQAAVPVIETARLTLRLPQIDDWAILEPIWTSDRSRHFGGPFTPEDAWLDFNQLVAGWVLRGHGALTICTKDGAVQGMVLLGHEFGDPDAELGWLLTADAEGHGYASEAAAALLPLCRKIYGADFVSYIAEANTASIRIAERLGAIKDAPHPRRSDDVVTYLYPLKGGSND
ncbi:GNAT family N-acetyltransferase [Yoonia sp. SS1-5]|uniref:GNAT family N-acetyltransferase n=1 Tax=Yoonia rhodophyticola TaxID=3137370 RepID=A0AAN0NII2_9RHOB